MKNAEFDVDVMHMDVIPEVVNGRIAHNWFNTFSYPLYRQGYDFVDLHMSEAQKKKCGIQPTLRGASQKDTDFVGEMYFCADEHTKRNGFNQFIETGLHEARHEICRGTGVKDDTHELHEKHGTITGQFKQLDMADYLPLRRELLKEKSRLEKIIEGLLNLVVEEKPQHFFAQSYPITQRFGVKNKIYTQTETHIGTDYGTPLSTLIYFPLSGTLTKSIGKETGLVATLETKKGTFQFLHLGHCLPEGKYKKGQVLGYTGNSGTKSTGPHCCVRLWRGEPNIAILTKENVHEHLIDVTTII